MLSFQVSNTEPDICSDNARDRIVPPPVTTEVDTKDLPIDVEMYCDSESLIDVENVSVLSGNLLH